MVTGRLPLFLSLRGVPEGSFPPSLRRVPLLLVIARKGEALPKQSLIPCDWSAIRLPFRARRLLRATAVALAMTTHPPSLRGRVKPFRSNLFIEYSWNFQSRVKIKREKEVVNKEPEALTGHSHGLYNNKSTSPG